MTNDMNDERSKPLGFDPEAVSFSALASLKQDQEPTRAREIFEDALDNWVQLLGEPGETRLSHKQVVQLWIEFAKMEISLRQFKQATKVYESAVTCPIAGAFPDVWLSYCKFCVERGKLSNARKIYIRAIGSVNQDRVDEVWKEFLGFVNSQSETPLTMDTLKQSVIQADNPNTTVIDNNAGTSNSSGTATTDSASEGKGVIEQVDQEDGSAASNEASPAAKEEGHPQPIDASSAGENEENMINVSTDKVAEAAEETSPETVAPMESSCFYLDYNKADIEGQDGCVDVAEDEDSGALDNIDVDKDKGKPCVADPISQENVSDDENALLAQLRKSKDSNGEMNRDSRKRRNASFDQSDDMGNRKSRRNRSPRVNRRRNNGRGNRRIGDKSPSKMSYQRNTPSLYFSDIPKTLPRMSGRPNLLFDEFVGKEPEPVTEELMLELSRSLVNKTIFDVVRDMQHSQIQNEKEILRRWQNLISTQIREGNDLYMKHQRSEIAANDSDIAKICEKHADERAEFSGRCRISQQQFIDITITELKNILREQQAKLHAVGVPSMFPSENESDIDLQRQIVALIMETGQIYKEKTPEEDWCDRRFDEYANELEQGADYELDAEANSLYYDRNSSHLNRDYAENYSNNTQYSDSAEFSSQRRRNAPGNGSNRTSAHHRAVHGRQVNRSENYNLQQHRQSMPRRRNDHRHSNNKNSRFREETDRQRGRFNQSGRRMRNNAPFLNPSQNSTCIMPKQDPANLHRQPEFDDDIRSQFFRRDFAYDYQTVDSYHETRVLSNARTSHGTSHGSYPIENDFGDGSLNTRMNHNGFSLQRSYPLSAPMNMNQQSDRYPRKN